MIQNAAARLILLADSRALVYELHERLGWDTMATRASKALVRITYACIYNQSLGYLYENLKPIRHHGRVTRSIESGNLQIPRTNTGIGENFFWVSGANPVECNQN